METRSMQLWPAGRLLNVKGDPHGPDLMIQSREGGMGSRSTSPWETPDDELRREIQAQCQAEVYAERDILCCDSSLVDMLLKQEGIDGFGIDDIENLSITGEHMDADDCKAWLEERNFDDTEREEDEDEDDYLDRLRQMVADEGEMQEVYEWWRVSSWLCDQLRDIGEPVIDNDYGYWWGRTCTGQGYIMDGTLQAIARRNQ